MGTCSAVLAACEASGPSMRRLAWPPCLACRLVATKPWTFALLMDVLPAKRTNPGTSPYAAALGLFARL
uniref:Secreted protein n=1 Tax=Macrostomum lignano TaxID=282301 RepID=A0A1I8FA47_9PLAT